jgi:TolB-like protein
MAYISSQEIIKGVGFLCINYKNRVSILALAVFLTGFTACFTTGGAETYGQTGSGTGTGHTAINERTGNNTGASRGPLFTGTGGKGLIIAVPSPSMSGSNQTNNWMPQLFQDIITGDLAKYSAMTVLDRRNESLVLAEQQLSASGNYSDDDYIAMGRLTNAKYIVAGNIIGVSGRYSVTFRINNTETNEIQTSFNKQYVTEDIESGLAAKEVVRELLAGMGVELTAEGERQLLAIQERTVRAQTSLARGMVAERNNEHLQSLVYFQEALNADRGMAEASQRIQSFGQGSPGAGIRERAEWATTQKAKWEKIFNDLVDYMDNNLFIAVYNFSTIEDQFDARTNRVTLTVKPGVKIIPDSTVLTVWKRVIDQWESIKNLEENKSWANSLTVKRSSVIRDSVGRDIRRQIGIDPQVTDRSYFAIIRLYDDAGIRISRNAISFSSGIINIKYNRGLQILPQERYYNNASFQPIRFENIMVSDITDNLSVEVSSIAYSLIYRSGRYQYNIRDDYVGNAPARIMSVTEWEEWLRR